MWDKQTQKWKVKKETEVFWVVTPVCAVLEYNTWRHNPEDLDLNPAAVKLRVSELYIVKECRL
jgi:hypothetical protein